MVFMSKVLIHPFYFVFDGPSPGIRNRARRCANMKKSKKAVFRAESKEFLRLLKIRDPTRTQIASDSVRRGSKVHVLYGAVDRACFFHLRKALLFVSLHAHRDDVRRLQGLSLQ